MMLIDVFKMFILIAAIGAMITIIEIWFAGVR